MVRLALQSPRPAVYLHTAEGAERIRHPASAARGQVVAVEVYVPRHKKIQVPVAVVVAPRGPGGPSAHLHSGLLRHVGKRSIVIVAVEPVLAPVRYVDV